MKAAQMLDEEIEGFKDTIRALKTRRNALLLISQLPPELISTIFYFVQTDPLSSTPYEKTKWTAVSHVCAHWRRVALETPRLWTCIDIRAFESGTWVETFLERSKRAPLTLSVNLTSRSQQRIEAVLGNMDRMRQLSLTLQIPMGQDLLEILETHPAPLLELLEINSFATAGSGRLSDNLFAGNHPSLRRLKLINCNLSWNLPTLKDLVALQISNPHIMKGSGQGPSLLQLTSMLNKSPNLEHLDFDGAFPISQTDVDFGSPILLSHLSKINLKSKISSCINLLNHISYPATSSISVRSLYNTSHTLPDILRIMRCTFSPEKIIGVRPPIRYLKVTSSLETSEGLLNIDGWCDPRNYQQEAKVSLGVEIPGDIIHPSVGESHSEFWSILPLEGLEYLHIGGLDLPKTSWLDLCGRLEQLTILRLDSLSTKAASSILEVLSSKRPNVQRKDKKRRQNTAHLYFPALRELSITEWNFESLPENGKQTSKLLKQLISCLKTRKKLEPRIEKMNLFNCRYLFKSGVGELKKVVSYVNWDMLEEMSSSEDEDDEDEYYGYDYWDGGDGDYDSDELEDLYFY